MATRNMTTRYKDDGLERYIVIGTWCEEIATAHCLAVSEEAAIAQWLASFREHGVTVAGWAPVASNVDRDRPDMQRFWEHDRWLASCWHYNYNEL